MIYAHFATSYLTLRLKLYLVDLYNQNYLFECVEDYISINKPFQQMAYSCSMQQSCSEQMNKSIEQDNLWAFIIYLIGDLGAQLRQSFAK